VTELEDAFRVQQLVARFANSFDAKDWDALVRCLASSLYTDYSDLRGTPPETMSRERFVELRRIALEPLKTHHLAGNVEVRLDGARGVARVSMTIHRRGSADDAFDTHCLYELGVEKTAQDWTICSIVQKVLWSDGQSAIHRGIPRA
jgi:SnoaL-like domain